MKRYRVTIDCCTSGYCFECHKRKTLGKPGRTVHSESTSRKYAEKVVKGWKDHHPVITEIDTSDSVLLGGNNK